MSRKDEYYSTGKITSRPASVELLSLHIAIVALAIFIGWLILESLRWIRRAICASIMVDESTPLEIFSCMPLFPMALIGGVTLQPIAKTLGVFCVIDPQVILRIQGWILDFLVVSAITAVSIKAVGGNLGAFLILSVGNIVTNLVLLLWLTPCAIDRLWSEHGIGGLDQSMGVTATGVILIRITDSDASSPASEVLGYKQLIFEPFLGGGLVTAMAIPIIYLAGAWSLFFVMLTVFVITILAGSFHSGPKEQHDRGV